MADAFTPLEQHVEAIKALLAQNRVDIRVGELGPHQGGPSRRVLFEPRTAPLEIATVTGKLKVFDGRWAKVFKTVPLNVVAHIVAESHTALWVLWNNVVVASHRSLKLNSIPGEVNLSPGALGMASHLHEGAQYLTQEFTWVFHLFDGIVDLPGYTEEISDILGTGEMVPMQHFTNTTHWVERDEIIPDVGNDGEGDAEEEEEP